MNYALILAAGSGTRMGNTDKPKQFLPIYGKPLMVHTIEVFEMHDEIDGIVIVTSEPYLDQVKVWCKQYDLSKVKAVCLGGDSRQVSVFNGLNCLKEMVNPDDIILIHDAARPLTSFKIISENIKECKKYDAVNTVIKSSDTIIVSKDGEKMDSIPNRSELYRGQTPQTFKFSLIYEAHQQAKEHLVPNVTDDCRLVLSIGKEVHMVEGSTQNFKITTFDDLMILKALLKVGRSEVL